MNKRVIKKGYTLEVVSWENDGDNYQTKLETFSSKEEAIALKEMCKKLFISSDNREGGIGNLMDYENKKAYLIIVKYLFKNPTILNLKNIKTPSYFKEEMLLINKITKAKESSDDWYNELKEYINKNNHSHILKYIAENPNAFEKMNALGDIEEIEDTEDWVEAIVEYMKETKENDRIFSHWIDFVGDCSHSLLGSSECYYSRIAESMSIYYSPEDVFLEEITKKKINLTIINLIKKDLNDRRV